LKKPLLIIVILIASLIGGYFVFSFSSGLLGNGNVDNGLVSLLKEGGSGDKILLEDSQNDQKIPEKPAEIIYSLLDGQKIEKNEDYLLAVVVENEISSRPQQKGLSKAQIVYEMPAEGGITRYLAIFSRDFPEQIGPLRSARPYLVEFAEQFEAIFLHAGGSDDALREINTNNDVLALNGLVYEGINYFRRDRKYPAPHNLFVQGKDIIANLQVLKWDFDLEKAYFDFSDRLVEPELSAGKLITVNFSEPAYKVNYIYQEKSGDYQRYVGGKLHLDGNVQVSPEKVGIIFTEYYPYDQDGRLTLRTKGKGDFWLLQKGKLEKGQWQREDGQMMEFLDENGLQFKFLPGQLFLEVIDSKNKLKIS
jgi:hypothetical protein